MKVDRDIRWRAAAIALLAVGVAGAAFRLLPGAGVEAPTGVGLKEDMPAAETSAARSATVPPVPAEKATERGAARRVEIERRFRQGVMMLHSGRHDHAATAFHRVLELEPRLPEAHVNMGFALLGLNRDAAAQDFFLSAIELRPEQANAYYGLALTWERVCDLEAARGAMRTYVHLASEDDRYVRKARAALWEWEDRAPGTAGCGEGQVRHAVDQASQ